MASVARPALCRCVPQESLVRGWTLTPLRAESRRGICIKRTALERGERLPTREISVIARSWIIQRRWQNSVTSASSSSSSNPTAAPHAPDAPTASESIQISKPRPYRRFLLYTLISAACFGVGFTMAAAPVVSTAMDTTQQLRNPPTDEETLTMFTPHDESVKEIEDRIWNHSLTQQLLKDEKFKAARPHLKIPPTLRNQNFMGGILQGPDLIAVPPLQFTTSDGSEFVSFQYLGKSLCGHPGIVHGGLIGTLLDEGCGRACFPALPNKIAVTASLKIDYKKPLMAGQIVVLRAWTTKAEGRKAWVEGQLESLPVEGKEVEVFAKAEALFIEPKGAKNMLSVPV